VYPADEQLVVHRRARLQAVDHVCLERPVRHAAGRIQIPVADPGEGLGTLQFGLSDLERLGLAQHFAFGALAQRDFLAEHRDAADLALVEHEIEAQQQRAVACKAEFDRLRALLERVPEHIQPGLALMGIGEEDLRQLPGAGLEAEVVLHEVGERRVEGQQAEVVGVDRKDQVRAALEDGGQLCLRGVGQLHLAAQVVRQHQGGESRAPGCQHQVGEHDGRGDLVREYMPLLVQTEDVERDCRRNGGTGNGGPGAQQPAAEHHGGGHDDPDRSLKAVLQAAGDRDHEQQPCAQYDGCSPLGAAARQHQHAEACGQAEHRCWYQAAGRLQHDDGDGGTRGCQHEAQGLQHGAFVRQRTTQHSRVHQFSCF